jgi:chemotaxis protein methyltransferase CheR
MANLEFQHHFISEREFEYLRQLIYREAGINLTEGKKCLVQTRIGKLMRRQGISNYDELFRRLENDKNGDYLVAVLDSISTNHTFFFREDSHFRFLSDEIVPKLVPRDRPFQLRIWSAGCSSGEEPYSLAITLAETFKAYPKADFRILATDLSTKVLNEAQKGVYPAEIAQNIPPELKKKYFMRGKNSHSHLIRVKEEVRSKVRFMRHNLLYVLDVPDVYDIVFCRNVMIYFDYQTKTKVVENIYQKIRNGGFFVTGHSESLSVIKHPFQSIKPTIYRRMN